MTLCVREAKKSQQIHKQYNYWYKFHASITYRKMYLCRKKQVAGECKKKYKQICLQVYHCEKCRWIQKTQNYVCTKFRYCTVYNCLYDEIKTVETVEIGLTFSP
jgi:hypothetical protein